jgi:hypothetical protein
MHWGARPSVSAVVTGAGAAGAGLFIATAVKLGRPIAGKPGGPAVDRRVLRPRGDRPRVAGHRHADRAHRGDSLVRERPAVILVQLGLYFALLSLLTFGGLGPVIPEMQRYIVDVKGWMTPGDFMQLFAVAQTAPGPNVLVTSLIGYGAAGEGSRPT